MKIRNFFAAMLFMVFLLLTGLVLKFILLGAGDTHLPEPKPAEDISIMSHFDSYVSAVLSDAEAAIQSAPKRFWISEDAQTVPIPSQSCYGESDDPAELQWLLEEAEAVLDGQDTLFNTDIQIYERSKVTYYLDESIFAITWKQPFGDFMYTICEVKITDPSQLRRYFADDTYGTRQLYTTTQMSSMVNAVVACSGDYYMCRDLGYVVYDGVLERTLKGRYLDTCFVDKNGDLLFAYRNQLPNEDDALKFVEENDVSFSFVFGPVLVDNGVRCEPDSYGVGQINGHYPRAAFGQRDELHYIIVVANAEGPYDSYQDIHQFAEYVSTFGCDKVYALDGGQTGAIVMNNELINSPHMGSQRRISDIFYFATAVPNLDSEK